jgi:CubicO group peptidase (beta-lactamase class C family)
MRFSVSLATAALLFAVPSLAQDPGAKADSVMKAAEAKGFSGVARIARNGNVILEKGYGLADRAAKIPFTKSTVVQIGSNTKDFTAVAILQLQNRGLLSVDDKLSRFFPNAPNDKKDITIWQLVKHEAGFPLGLGGDFEPVSKAQLIDNAMKFKLLFPPGSRKSYSNTGYALLAAVIEQVSGKSYDNYIRDNILAPLGLTHTGFLLPQFPERDLAHGYRANGEDAGTMLAKPHAADGPYWNLRGNGGMLSTVSDMHEFYQALFETDKLLPRNARNGMFDPNEPAGLAGSDLVNFFLYERMPRLGLEIIMASTNAAMKVPMVRRDLGAALGLQEMGGPEGGNDDAPLARASGTPVAAGASAIIDQLVALINKGDKDELSRFVSDHFMPTADVPPSQRAERLAGLRSDLGALTVLRKTQVENGPIQVVVKTEKEGEAILVLDMEPVAPFRIRRFGIQVGG